MFVESQWGNITELDCSTLPFTKVKTIKTDLKGLEVLRTVSTKISVSGLLVEPTFVYMLFLWMATLFGLLNSRRYPSGSIIYVDGLGLLVGGYREVAVLDPEDGSHLQTVDLLDARLCTTTYGRVDDQIIVLH